MSTRFVLLQLVLGLIAAASLAAQNPSEELNQAYKALASRDYDTAIDLFRKGLAKQPGSASVHKDLAYTLLKTGENEAARDEFEAARRLDPKDEAAALEYAFLAFETKKAVEARRVFDQLRKTGGSATRATAEQAFQNIDKPLADGIARWKEALARSPNPNDIAMFSAHWELAQLAELRDDLPLAAEQYEICRRLKPQLSELLLILARVWEPLNRADEARAAVLAASRSSNSRTAELGLEALGSRYPYPYEFLAALKIDPQNVALHRELAYLYLAMHEEGKAKEQFEQALAIDPHDRLSRDQLDALNGVKKSAAASVALPKPAPGPAGNPSGTDAKSMGEKSLALGYVPDAIKYLTQAHEDDPSDGEVILKLAQAYNQAKDDKSAIHWFDVARQSDDPQIAAEATKSFRALSGDVAPQTTMWALPMFSTRWMDLFTYGQVKRTVPMSWLKTKKLVSFYVSTRFDGDVRSGLPAQGVAPEYFSTNSFVFAAGAASTTWHHLTGWVEAGEAVKYLPDMKTTGAAVPDYRGGLNFGKGFGSLLGSNKPGLFYETTDDALYVSRFDKDWLFYSQHRSGRTFQLKDGIAAQLLFNVNFTHDVKSQYWANTVEMGPGFKLHFHWLPPNVYFATDFLRGVYTNNEGNPRRPNYDDIRVGFWYARTTR